MPHTIQAAPQHRRVVVVGGGPAGLESARVAAERGHAVTLFEAQDRPGGQVLLAARARRRAEMVGIIDWRIAELGRLGVEIRLNTLAEAGDVLAEDPDIVVIATGGLPDTEICAGADLAISSWEVMAGDAKPGGDVLVFDDHGQEQGLQVAEFLAEAGSKVEIVTPERTLGVDVSGFNHVPYGRAFARLGVRATITTRLRSIARQGNRLVATLAPDFAPDSGGESFAREIDQVVIEHGTVPMDDLYFALKPRSRNRGEVDQRALINGRPQEITTNPEGTFRLFRIGDAVASRNIHAAIYDGLRFAKDF